MKLTFFRLPVEVPKVNHGQKTHAFWRLNEVDRKAFARALVERLLSNKTISRQPCCVCGDPKGEAHHESYDRPYEICWLCHKHHHERHAEINKSSPPRKRWILKAPVKGTPISRQLKLQKERREKGLCVRCGAPAVSKSFCLEHLIRSREYRAPHLKGTSREYLCLSRRLQNKEAA
jgi:hypothetical protein